MADYESRAKKIGERIKEGREKLGLSQGDFLEKIYMARGSTKTLKAWEDGKRLPDLDSLARIAELFQCDIGYLLCDYKERLRDVADVCAFTGLSEEAVNNLIGINKYEPKSLWALDVILKNSKYWIFHIDVFIDEVEDIYHDPLEALASYLSPVSGELVLSLDDKRRESAHTENELIQRFLPGYEVSFYDGDTIFTEGNNFRAGRLIDRANLDHLETSLKKLKEKLDPTCSPVGKIEKIPAPKLPDEEEVFDLALFAFEEKFEDWHYRRCDAEEDLLEYRRKHPEEFQKWLEEKRKFVATKMDIRRQEKLEEERAYKQKRDEELREHRAIWQKEREDYIKKHKKQNG